mgnify:CR=1 FL=1
MLRNNYQKLPVGHPKPLNARIMQTLAVLLAAVGIGHVAAEGTLVVSMEPYREVAEALAPAGTEIRVVLPSGQSPHAYEPAPSDAAALEDADLVIFNGGVDEWMTSLIATVGSSQRVVRAADAAEALDANHEGAHDHDEHGHDEHDHDEHDHEEHDHDEHDHSESETADHNHEVVTHDHEDVHKAESSGQAHDHGDHDHDHDGDLHVWQSIAVMKHVAEDVADALVDLHPSEADAINAALADYIQHLNELDQELEATYSQVQGRPMVFMHGAWDRLVERYNLNQVAIIEPFPGREPTASYLADVLQTIEDSGANVIFSERQLNPRPATVIAQEAGVQVAVLDPVGGGDTGGYTDMMLYNARTIVNALSATE